MWFLDKLFPVAELWFSKLIVYIQTNTVYNDWSFKES